MATLCQPRSEAATLAGATNRRAARKADVGAVRFRLRVLRAKCVDCIDGRRKATQCNVQDCELWDYRTGHRPRGRQARRTPLRALRAYCVTCCGGDYREVRLCPATRGAFWPWRMGSADGEAKGKEKRSVGLRAGDRETEPRPPPPRERGRIHSGAGHADAPTISTLHPGLRVRVSGQVCPLPPPRVQGPATAW